MISVHVSGYQTQPPQSPLLFSLFFAAKSRVVWIAKRPRHNWYDVPDSKVHGANMGPSGADRTQVGPMLAPWTLLSGVQYIMLMTWRGNAFRITSHLWGESTVLVRNPLWHEMLSALLEFCGNNLLNKQSSCPPIETPWPYCNAPSICRSYAALCFGCLVHITMNS